MPRLQSGDEVAAVAGIAHSRGGEHLERVAPIARATA